MYFKSWIKLNIIKNEGKRKDNNGNPQKNKADHFQHSIIKPQPNALISGVFRRGLVGVNPPPPWPDRRTGVHCNLQPLHKLAAYVDWTQLSSCNLYGITMWWKARTSSKVAGFRWSATHEWRFNAFDLLSWCDVLCAAFTELILCSGIVWCTDSIRIKVLSSLAYCCGLLRDIMLCVETALNRTCHWRCLMATTLKFVDLNFVSECSVLTAHQHKKAI